MYFRTSGTRLVVVSMQGTREIVVGELAEWSVVAVAAGALERLAGTVQTATSVQTRPQQDSADVLV